MANPLILIVAHTHQWLINAFEKAGYQVIYNSNMSYTEAQQHIIEAVGIVAGNRWPIDKRLISSGTNLKWIGRLGSGMEKIDVAFAENNGIKCLSSPEGNSNAVAEHALGLLLALTNNIVKSNNQISQNKWLREINRGIEIYGKTIGIIGYGHTGSKFAMLLTSFNCTILANDIKILPLLPNSYTQGSLLEIAQKADIISFHLPLNNSTTYLANDAFFNSCANTPIILNTSRGGVIQTKALINALKNNKIAGAGLDVLENENLALYNKDEQESLDFLNAHPNVILTPHIAGYSNQSLLKMAEVLFNKITALNG